MLPFATKGHCPPFVVLFPIPPRRRPNGVRYTFMLISFLDSSERSLAIYSSVLRRRRFVGPRDSDVCISSGRTTFDGARQSGHATDTPLRRVIDRATSAVANESEHDAHIAWEHSKTVASAVSLS